MLSNRGHLRLSFDIIYRDLTTLFAYVEPCDQNLATYSHEIFSLFLRTCTEIEAILKLLAQVKSYTPVITKARPTIKDYRGMEQNWLGFENRYVGLHFWRPGVKYIQPFENWTTCDPPVPWYAAYNRVKHDREAKFPEANFGNLVLAFAGLFQTAIQTSILPTNREWEQFRKFRFRISRRHISPISNVASRPEKMKPNKPPETMPPAVTPAAAQPARQP